MNSATEMPAGWSPSRFWLVAAVIFAGQVGWIFLLGERFQAKPARNPERSIVRMLPTPLDEEKWSKYVFVVDPTVIPTSSSHGFADLAWHQLPAKEYSAPLPRPSPVFLEFADQRPVAATTLNSRPLLQLPTPSAAQSSGPSLEPSGRQASMFRIGGALAARQIDANIALPEWTNSDLLTNTVIQFGANRAGQVFTEALLEGSGLDEADQAALALVRDFRFRPAPRTAPPETWDTAIFCWRTIPPSTNSAK